MRLHRRGLTVGNMFLVVYIIGVLLLIGFLVALAIVQAIGEHQENLDAQRHHHHRVS